MVLKRLGEGVFRQLLAAMDAPTLAGALAAMNPRGAEEPDPATAS
jgi:hypothetical protein